MLVDQLVNKVYVNLGFRRLDAEPFVTNVAIKVFIEVKAHQTVKHCLLQFLLTFLNFTKNFLLFKITSSSSSQRNLILLKFFNLINMNLQLLVKKPSFTLLISILVSFYHHLSIKLSHNFCLN